MKNKPVKIVATLGPATHSKAIIADLARAGVDIFRINLSHAHVVEVAERCQWIREAEKVVNRPLTIMGDLPGPKIRISEMKEDTFIRKGDTFLISKDTVIGNEKGCGLNHSSIIDILEVGAEVFMDDGSIKMVVRKKVDNGVETEVLVGGHLKSRKGFSAEGISLGTTGVSEKDRAGIALMLEHNADALAISFVQTKEDVLAVKELLPRGTGMMLIAKIETAGGVANAEEILEVSHGMMVARGDLGLAVPIAQVPHIQKRLIDLCVSHGKPVITATQMLESMISKPIPTRAEVADVANAILDRTDAIMLSAETADGKFPVETVEMMVKIIDEASSRIQPQEDKEEQSVTNAISYSVGRIAQKLEAKMIMAYTQTGATATRIAKHRHPFPILAVSPNEKIIRNLNFVWGVHPYLIAQTENFDTMLVQAKQIAKENPYLPLEAGDIFVISAGMPFGESGTTNMILVENV
ncbi:MAG TPA: pyruvate kinase [Patescibacteria group bacterium]|nr:pyruvate kinase [Patescibacteria group bacterium]